MDNSEILGPRAELDATGNAVCYFHPQKGEPVSSMTMREPLVSDQMAVSHEQDPAKREVAVFANLCNVAPQEVQALSVRNYGIMQEAYSLFL